MAKVCERENQPSKWRIAHMGWFQIEFQDHLGDWWVPTRQGLYRFRAILRISSPAATLAIYSSKKGTASRQYFSAVRGFQRRCLDRNGEDGARHSGQMGRSTKLPYLHRADGIGLCRRPDLPRTTAETSGSGSILRLMRYRDGRSPDLPRRGAPTSLIRGMFLDTRDTYGLPPATRAYSRSITRRAEHPVFSHLTTSDGLASNQVTTVIEDKFDHLYIGTGAGWTGRSAHRHIRHYTVADGLADNYINVSFRDHSGALWFGSLQGLQGCCLMRTARARRPP